MSRRNVLVCDDELLIRMWLEEHLREAGYRVESVGEGQALLASLARAPADLVLLDLRLPDAYGIDLIPLIHKLDPTLPVIMMTAYGEVQTAIAAVRAGAHHFVEKPIELSELLLLVEQALEQRRVHHELEQYREGCRWQFSNVTLVGRSAAMRRIAELVMRLAEKRSAVNVLVRGESGCGKDVIARAIHARGPRSAHPFISVNCTALPEHLVESELFGHDAGAFTDARQAKKGLFELADRGTIFLDEIGDMPLGAQSKLLGFLETHRFRRVGGVHDIEVDTHVVAATNRRLEEAVATGQVREDLFYRLNVIPIDVPPLRERPEDIAPLAQYFVQTLCNQLRQPVRSLAPATMAALEACDWPGNARQLSNTLERLLLLTDDDPIPPESLPPEVRGAGPQRRTVVLPPNGVQLEQLERELITQALERAAGNKTSAARLLGLSRDTLRYRLEKYGIR